MKKFIIFTILFFGFFQNIFAFDIEIQTNKTEITANDNLKFTITISDAKENVEIWKIF